MEELILPDGEIVKITSPLSRVFNITQGSDTVTLTPEDLNLIFEFINKPGT